MEKATGTEFSQSVRTAQAIFASAHRIGLYGGSFDPVHNGHLILAREAKEQLALDCVIFIPARISPHKEGSPPIHPSDRLDMVAAAIDGEADFFVDDLEIHREGPSFTIDTVRKYRTDFPRAAIYYLIGGDNVAELHTWKEIAALQELVTFVVLERGAAHEVPEGCEQISRNISISSTDIRNRVASGYSIRYLVPEMVHEIIRSRQLYVR